MKSHTESRLSEGLVVSNGRSIECGHSGCDASSHVSWVRFHGMHRVIRRRSVCGSPVAQTLQTLSDIGDLSWFGLLSSTSNNIVPSS
jgi:hypothetical protein